MKWEGEQKIHKWKWMVSAAGAIMGFFFLLSRIHGIWEKWLISLLILNKYIFTESMRQLFIS